MTHTCSATIAHAAALAVALSGATRLVARDVTPQALTPLRSFALALDGAPTRGRTTAPLTLVEFADFECPTSVRYARDVFDRLQREYVAPGKVRYIFRNFPLAKHPHAFEAAEAAQCATEQGRFWELRPILFANQQALGRTDLATYAGAAGLEKAAFARCFTGASSQAKVRRDVEEGARAGVTGTPTLLAGVLDPDGTFHVLREFSSLDTYASIKDALDRILDGRPQVL